VEAFLVHGYYDAKELGELVPIIGLAPRRKQVVGQLIN